MTRRRLLRQLDVPRVMHAIAQAEARTSGEIRVSVAGFFRGDPRRLAESAFKRLGIESTRHRNGVLILIAPTRRHIVILGDAGINARVQETFWSQQTQSLTAGFRGGNFTETLAATIERIGVELATHFPQDSNSNSNSNELPDELDVT